MQTPQTPQIPRSAADLFNLVEKSELVERARLITYQTQLQQNHLHPADAMECAQLLVCDGIITQFQAKLLLQGKWKNFFLGSKYKVLDQLGAGGMGSVFLCEHRYMRRRVAVKILPPEKSQSASLIQRFLREAQAVACLDHPNIIRAHDIGQHGALYFLVLEYAEGINLQQLVEESGRLSIPRATNYIVQAAFGLQHAFEAGLVHRDIKPANLMLDRHGTIKILDLGLARFSQELSQTLTQNGDDQGLLGTADYIAPEQALDAASVDVRADIYSLGATFYYLLTGKVLFDKGNVAQKLIHHQTVPAPLVAQLRPETPHGITQLVARMLAKNPAQRPATPAAVVEALKPWFMNVPAPTADELPAGQFSQHGDVDAGMRTSGSGNTMYSSSTTHRAAIREVLNRKAPQTSKG